MRPLSEAQNLELMYNQDMLERLRLHATPIREFLNKKLDYMEMHVWRGLYVHHGMVVQAAITCTGGMQPQVLYSRACYDTIDGHRQKLFDPTIPITAEETAVFLGLGEVVEPISWYESVYHLRKGVTDGRETLSVTDVNGKTDAPKPKGDGKKVLPIKTP